MATQDNAFFVGVTGILVDTTGSSPWFQVICDVVEESAHGNRSPFREFLMTHSDTPQVSVILCSRDRSEQVSLCLERFDMSELVKLSGELVLVDSASSDNTREVFDRFKAQNPDADVHCCRNCEFDDPGSYNECRETQAERVLEKDRSNFCDYFAFKQGASGRPASGASPGSKHNPLDDLFK